MYRFVVKRVLGFVLALAFLILFCWLYIIIAVGIILSSGFPVFFLQTRVGYKGKSFRIYKFRTMVKDAESLGPKSTKKDDCRITNFGKILRKTSLDELPQLFNVLKGDMSLVGFRPGVPENYKEDDYSSGIFDVRPGITGMAQVKGRSNLTVDEKRNWELEYSKKCSFLLDCKIIAITIWSVLAGRGVN